jgi:hypothetical protein
VRADVDLRRLHDGFRRLAAPVFLGALPLVVLGWLVISAHQRNLVAIDFRGELYPEARMVVHGQNPFPPPDADLSGGVNRIWPIPAALFVAPLTALPPQIAAYVFTALLTLAFAATLLVLDIRDWRVWGAAFLWPPTLSAIQTANLTIVLGLFVAVAWRYRSRRFVPGLLIGAAIALKFFLWPLVVWLVATRRYASALVASAIAAASFLLVLPFTGLGSYLALVRNLSATFDGYSLNVFGFLTQSGVGDGIAHGVSLVVAGATLVAAFRLRSLPLTIVACLLFSPIVWMHFYALLVIPLAIAYPSLNVAWLLPWAMWECPGGWQGVRPWQSATGVAVLALTVLSLQLKARPRLRPAPAS